MWLVATTVILVLLLSYKTSTGGAPPAPPTQPPGVVDRPAGSPSPGASGQPDGHRVLNDILSDVRVAGEHHGVAEQRRQPGGHVLLERHNPKMHRAGANIASTARCQASAG
jgi:hypothetical protein